MFQIKVYTETPRDNYALPVAGSVHMAYSTDGQQFQLLNQGFGMLFPKAEINKDNTIAVCYINNPKCLQKDGLYAVAADYLRLEGNIRVQGKQYLWTTKDFLTFEDKGLVDFGFLTEWETVEENIFRVPDEMGKAVTDTWEVLTVKEVRLPGEVTVENISELQKVKATFVYSDGSTDEKCVDWKLPAENATGQFTAEGRVRKEDFPYPLAKGYADPVLFRHMGKWFFLSTNDNLDDVGLYLRSADTVAQLFDGSAEESCILPYCPEKGFVQTFWAPEFHVIGGEIYILFAVGGVQWSPRCHMMKLKAGGNLMNPCDWEEPVRVLKKDGSYLTEKGITLDMTHFSAAGRDYLAWSYRFGIGTPLDTGSMIYLAETCAEKPWQLISEPVLLTRPLLGWENTQGTINNEGPYALLTEDKVYLAYSGGSANGYSYAVGYLTAAADSDLLNIENWSKHPCPVLNSYSVGIDGPGHNSFFVNEEGKTMVAYHGQLDCRCSALHRVHFNKSGFPLLNMAPDRDIPEEYRSVTVKVRVRQAAAAGKKV